VKDIHWISSSKADLMEFPATARAEAGYQLHLIQTGEEPSDWKPMQAVGAGVREIRVRQASGAFRIVYVASLENAIYVLHAFQKKTRKTSQTDIKLAAQRYKLIGGQS